MTQTGIFKGRVQSGDVLAVMGNSGNGDAEVWVNGVKRF